MPTEVTLNPGVWTKHEWNPRVVVTILILNAAL